MNRNWLLAAFAVTRLAMAAAAVTSSGIYDRIETDANLYAQYAQQLVAGAVPYRDVDVEYPPVLLPFLVAPALALPPGAYRVGWVALMLAADSAGLAGALRLDRRFGGSAARWWVALIALLGPLVYTRYDLLPAVASVWALERAAAGREGGAGAWLAVGALAKLWPGLLVPTFLVAARRPWRLVAGGAVAAAVILAPLAGVLPDLAGDVLGYHTARGIQIESVWANGLLLAHRLAGYPIEVVRNFGAAHVGSTLSGILKACSTVLSLAAVTAATVLARRLRPDGARGLLALAFALLAVLVVTGSVLSPQFLVWVAALAATSQADPASPVRTAVRWLVPTALVNHALYPTFYPALVRRFAWSAIGVLSVRNLLLLIVAATAVAGLARARVTAPIPARVLEPAA